MPIHGITNSIIKVFILCSKEQSSFERYFLKWKLKKKICSYNEKEI